MSMISKDHFAAILARGVGGAGRDEGGVGLVEEVLEESVETEHQLEEEMEVLGLSPQLLEQQHITPVVVVAGVTTLYQVLEEVLEA